ncbi:flagellar motor switch protein FliG [Enterovirga sp.]|uniref:flagellar motor switch protein FliG n=1 Tax=Enterovirga sp. TaxID=2026350 RepID=UPI002620578B|nr:flagellar motor switch protein FliG [Enterovirga sp.]MDB5591817.1 flagellar motor switch protein FliG [Enterovirga sp.]
MSAALQRQDAPALTGPQRAAALLILLGDEHGAGIWSQFSEAEIRKVCMAMAELGAIPGETVHRLMQDFAAEIGATGTLTGSAERAEELLAKIFPPERVAAVMADVRGSSGRQVWRRLAHVGPDALAAFLKDEYAQTVAVVLSRIGPDQGGRVLALLPDRLAAEVVPRMLGLGEVRADALERIEDALDRHFFSGGSRKSEHDRYELMADRFNAFDRPTEARFLAALEHSDRDAAQRIREKMFTFEDLLKLDPAGCQTLLRSVDKDVLARALKGASEAARAFFFANMSTRAAKNLQDDLEAMGPVRMREVDEAQSRLVSAAKALAETGEIRISKSRADDEVVL